MTLHLASREKNKNKYIGFRLYNGASSVLGFRNLPLLREKSPANFNNGNANVGNVNNNGNANNNYVNNNNGLLRPASCYD